MADKKTQVTTTTPATTTPQQAKPAEQGGYRLPTDATLKHAAKLAIVEDRPILMDYWTSSLEKKSLIGLTDNNQKLLVKSEDEYTSPVAKLYRSGTELIVMTENSIYIVAADIPSRKVNL
jgi:hypothetical protein